MLCCLGLDICVTEEDTVDYRQVDVINGSTDIAIEKMVYFCFERASRQAMKTHSFLLLGNF